MMMKRVTVAVTVAAAITCIFLVSHWSFSEVSVSTVEDVSAIGDLVESENTEADHLQPIQPQLESKYENTAEQPVRELDPEEVEYLKTINNAQTEALNILESNGWQQVSGKTFAEGIVYSKHSSKWGYVYKLEAKMQGVSADVLFKDMIVNSELVPTWNPTMKKVKVIRTLDNHTEISYSVSASAVGGMVSSRDFVYIRHWGQLNGWHVTSSVSIPYPSIPPKSKIVRGEQGPSIIRMKDTAANILSIEWLLNTNIKGMVPSWVLKRAYSGTLLSYLKYLRKHSATLV